MFCLVFKYLAGQEGGIHSLTDASMHNKTYVKINH